MVLGFGKVWRSLAHALQRRSCRVSVCDTDAIRRLQALSEGFVIPNKNIALNSSDLVFGATGFCSLKDKDFPYIRNGAFLISCSSKKHEFDLESMRSQYRATKIAKNVERLENLSNHFYLLGKGTPINFLDGSAIGPLLFLSHAEMLLAIQKLVNRECEIKLQQLDEQTRQHLATIWIEHFLDQTSGHYKS